jgi:alkylhydroperoxidase/carboxymuconolactone decarboxylase family protein YurZ
VEKKTIDPTTLKARFVDIHGDWEPRWQAALDLDPEFFQAYLAFAAAAYATSAIDAKTRELILLAVNVQTTTLHENGIRTHIDRARKAGATQAEIVEVVEIVSVLGMHSPAFGLPIMLEEFAKAGHPVNLQGELTPQQAAVKESYTRRRGFWNESVDLMLRLDHDFFEAYSNLSALPWDRGGLPPKIKEFIYITIDAAPTHLYEPGLRIHIRNAMRHGATPAEINAVFQIISTLAFNSLTVGSPLVHDFSPTSR